MIYSAHYKRTLALIMEKENKFLIPLAVIVAGVLVAGAVFFKSNTSGPTTNEPKEIVLAPVTETDHIFGSPNAKIKLVEFADIDCPACAYFNPIVKRLMDTYGKTGEVALVYRQFPLENIHPMARTKAESAECVASLAGNDTFWKYLDALYAQGDAAGETNETLEELPALAASLGVDQAAFEACVADRRFSGVVDAHMADGTAAGIQGTPYTVVILPDGTYQPIEGAMDYDTLKKSIDLILANFPEAAAATQ